MINIDNKYYKVHPIKCKEHIDIILKYIEECNLLRYTGYFKGLEKLSIEELIENINLYESIWDNVKIITCEEFNDKKFDKYFHNINYKEIYNILWDIIENILYLNKFSVYIIIANTKECFELYYDKNKYTYKSIKIPINEDIEENVKYFIENNY